MTSSPSVQLYTVREAISDDLQGAVARIAGIGFTKVEPYAFVERADEFAKAFSDSGVTAPTGHASVIDSDEPQKAFDAANQLGIGLVIDPFIPTDRWQTADDAARLADRVNELAQSAAAAGLRFGYHNHQWEFANRVDGRPVFEFFVERLAPEVELEIDTFWATVGGIDVPAYLRTLGDRVQALHIKDGPVSGDIATALPSSESALVVPDTLKDAFERQVPAGQGDVDIPAVLAAAPSALRVVEFDAYQGEIFSGVTESFAWLTENDK